MSDKIQCVHHGAMLKPGNFYMALPDSIYKGIGRIPVCKKCIEDIIDVLYNEYKDVKLVVFHLCRQLDIPFDTNFYNGANKAGNTPRQTFSYYMTQLNSLGKQKYSGGFDTGEILTVLDGHKDDEEITVEKAMKPSVLTESDKENKYQVIKILGQDPYFNMSEESQKVLYNDLINYLHDENIVEDQFLLSQVMQIVVNNHQIREIDNAMSKLMKNHDDIKNNIGKINALNSAKKNLVSNNNQIAKESGINSGKFGGKSTLTETIEKLVKLDFEDAEVDFYDQKLSYGMQRASDISHKSVLEFLQLDDADIRDMMLDQRQLLQDYQAQLLKKEEHIRLLSVLNLEYRRKYGEINEDIQNEIRKLKAEGVVNE